MNKFLSLLNPFDWLGLDGARLSSMLQTWGFEVSPAAVNRFLDIATPVILLSGILAYVLWKVIRRRIAVRKWRRITIESRLGREFAGFMNKKNQQCYVRDRESRGQELSYTHYTPIYMEDRGTGQCLAPSSVRDKN